MLLQLRALFGVNTRAEIIQLLLVNESMAIQEIADQSFYSWHAIQSTLQDMDGSGMLIHGGAKRNRKYSLIRENWAPLFGLPTGAIRWIDHARHFGIFVGLWEKCSDSSMISASPTLQATVMRKWVVETAREVFDMAGYSALVHRVEHAKTESVIDVLWDELTSYPR